MPSPLAIMVLTVTSLVTLTMVLNISKILSTGKIMAIQAGFRPTASNTIMSITNPALGTAAEPIEDKVAVTTIIICWVKVKSIMCNCAKNTTATAWYKHVPSILTVAPMGNTKLVTFLSTPRFSSTHSIVTGNVAALLEVENANVCAGAIALKNPR